MATDSLQNATETLESNDLSQLHKFLCYGSENGSYKPSCCNKEVSTEDAQCILRLTENGHGEEVVKEICAFSKDGFSVRQDPVIFALAVCAKQSKDLKTKRAALKAVITVCPTAAQLFRFVEYTEKLSGKTTGWGRGQRKAVSEWYNRKESGPLAIAVTKYIQRNGWSHLDLIRLAHIKPERDAIAVCLKYVVKGLEATKKQYGSDCPSAEVTSVLAYLQAVDTVKHSTDAQLASRLIEQFQLAREHIPTHYINSKEVWRALLQHMPLVEMMENLSKMTSLGLLDTAGKHSQAPLVIDRLKNDTLIKDSRVQPFQVLLALKTYELGKVEKGKFKWVPNSSILEALTSTFHSSFKNVPATNKRYLIAVDVDSMSKGPVIGSNFLPPAVAAAAMTMIVARTEQQCQLVVGSEKITPAELTGQMYLNEIIQAVSQAPGERKRNCANPVIWATENKKTVDVFVIFTDGDTSESSIHPREALKKYRDELSIPDARLVVCGLTDSKLSLADSGDSRVLDIVGFDVGSPQVIHNFVTDKL